MRRVLILLALLFGAVAFANTGAAFQLVKPSGTGWSAYCSGAVVERHGVTAGHCAEAGERVYLRDYAGYIYLGRVTSSCYEWPACDNAVIEGAFVWLLDSLETAALPEPGTVVSYVGTPSGLGLFTFRGRYLGLMTLDPGFEQIHALPLFDVSSAGGSSGSIILDAEGRAISILVGGFLGAVTCTPQQCWARKPLDAAFGTPLPEF